MLNSASTEMQQQYMDEIMKQSILRICQENAKLESAIVHTDRKTTSEPPVEEVLVAVSLITDTETYSGMMEQWQENVNINDDDDDEIDLITPT